MVSLEQHSDGTGAVVLGRRLQLSLVAWSPTGGRWPVPEPGPVARRPFSLAVGSEGSRPQEATPCSCCQHAASLRPVA